MTEFCSTRDRTLRVSLKQAVLSNVPGDGGLFMPTQIPVVKDDFIKKVKDSSYAKSAFDILSTLLSDQIPLAALGAICEKAFTFDIKLPQLSDNLFCLELFHGPTYAFKDFGVRFMAELLSFYREKESFSVLTATSGDTGGAVASAFFNRPGFDVFILYPKGKISEFQEQQIASLGGNIRAIQVDGSFDDCQRLVKQALVDSAVKAKHTFCSANSINIARLLPQVCYYFRAVSLLLGSSKELVFSVPSGNFGNLTAGVMAKKMGLPIKRFIASTNINDVVPRYLESGQYKVGQFRETLSSAMDIADPNNFVRTKFLYKDSFESLTADICGRAFDDNETKKAMKSLWENNHYLSEPHAAVAFLGLQNNFTSNETGVFLGTAHPMKFQEIVEDGIGRKILEHEKVKMPRAILKNTSSIAPTLDALRDALI